jgi:hypothetical protein
MKAIDYIKKGWTQGALALDKNWKHVPPADPRAVCWCAKGAIWAAHSLNIKRKLAATQKLQDVIGEITTWNDDLKRTKEEVLAAFEKAGI